MRAILDSHYLNRDPALAESAIRKLSSKEERNLPTDLPTGRECSAHNGEKSLEMIGGRTRTRTLDPLIKSQLLYQLSYAP